jgi:hypothetical protein
MVPLKVPLPELWAIAEMDKREERRISASRKDRVENIKASLATRVAKAQEISCA